MRWHEPDLKVIDNWRRNHPDLPNQTDAIRRLVRLGLIAQGYLKDRKP